jgi:putative sugar O-methyltransferase
VLDAAIGNSELKLLVDSQAKAPACYRPARYWLYKTKISANLIQKYGIENFRSTKHGRSPSFSYSDVMILDSRSLWYGNLKKFIARLIFAWKPFKTLFDGQVAITKQVFDEVNFFKSLYVNSCEREYLQNLLTEYSLPESTAFGCDAVVNVKGKNHSTFYLETLSDLAMVSQSVNLKNVKSMIEIGPGFGANIHTLLHNFTNIRKVILIDIVPNVYVVSEYLKRFFGNAVKTYSDTKNLQKITFRSDDSLEIFVLPTWEIDKVQEKIDLFWNAHSFVEMSPDIIKNYSRHIDRNSYEKSEIVLMSYDQFEPTTTIDPSSLPKFFEMFSFNLSRKKNLFDPRRDDYFLIGKK